MIAGNKLIAKILTYHNLKSFKFAANFSMRDFFYTRVFSKTAVFRSRNRNADSNLISDSCPRCDEIFRELRIVASRPSITHRA